VGVKPGLSVIVVVLDSLRQDHVGLYRRLLGLQRVFERG
jgi:hypothetical protein